MGEIIDIVRMDNSIFIHNGKSHLEFRNLKNGLDYLNDQNIPFSRCTFYPSVNNKPDIHGSIKIMKLPKIQLKDRYRYLSQDEYNEEELDTENYIEYVDETINFDDYSEYENRIRL